MIREVVDRSINPDALGCDPHRAEPRGRRGKGTNTYATTTTRAAPERPEATTPSWTGTLDASKPPKSIPSSWKGPVELSDRP